MYCLYFILVIFYLTTFCYNSFCFQFDFSNSFDILKKYTWCNAFECCNDDHIPAKFDVLEQSLNEKFYGQHIAKQIVLNVLKEHFHDKNPKKALTLSFHGLPGIGKNYITEFIKKALYKHGSKSKFVHQFTARIHFPSKDHISRYQSDLQNWLKGNISICERSLFIFDEVDKIPEGVVNAIKPMLDYNDIVDRVDYRKAVFIFLSNTGGTIIKDRLIHLWQQGKKRNDITLQDFELLIAKGAFNEKGGFYHSDTIKHNLIDHYIPFLPLERKHVEMCIKDAFLSKGVYDISNVYVEKVMQDIEWGPEPINIYSNTGCKRISQKIPLIIKDYNLRRKNTEF